MENTQITELVTLKDDGQAVTTSLLIAERFGKQHKDVLKAIKNCDCSEEFSRRNFSPSEKGKNSNSVGLNNQNRGNMKNLLVTIGRIIRLRFAGIKCYEVIGFDSDGQMIVYETQRPASYSIKEEGEV